MADNHFKIDRGASFTPRTAAPSNPINGDVYYDSTMGSFSLFNNGKWINFSSKSDVASATSLTSADFTSAKMQSTIIRVTGSTVASIYGMSAGSDGQYLIIYNQSSAITTVKNQSVTEGTAVNRIITYNGVDQAISAGQSTLFMYDGTQNRWVVILPSVSVSVAAYQVTATYTAGFTQALTGQINSTTQTGASLYTSAGGGTYTGLDTYAAALVNSSNPTYIAALFKLATSGSISSARLRLLRQGTVSGNLFVAIYSDSSYSPSSLLATSNAVTASGVSTSSSNVDFTFASPYAATAEQVLWMVLYGDSTYYTSANNYGPNYIQWEGNTTYSSNQNFSQIKFGDSPSNWFGDLSVWRNNQVGFTTNLTSYRVATISTSNITGLSSTINIVEGAAVTGEAIFGTSYVRKVVSSTVVQIDPPPVYGMSTTSAYSFTNPAHELSGDNVQALLDKIDQRMLSSQVVRAFPPSNITAADNGKIFLMTSNSTSLGPNTFNLPDPPMANFRFTVVLNFYNAITSSITIFQKALGSNTPAKINDVNAPYTINARFGTFTFYSDGIDWFIS